jgi:uncharacterized protein involved in outer membrane biogenesis
MPRLILIPIAIVIILVLAALVLVPLLLDKDKVLDIASSQLKEQTGAILTVDGETGLSVFPVLGISLEQASLTMPGEQQPGITVGSLSIGVQMMPLLSGSVEIDSISVDDLKARLTGAPEQARADTASMSDDELDTFYAKRRSAMSQAGESAGAEAALAVPLALNVQELIVTNSRIETLDPESQEVSAIDITRLQATGLNLDQQPIPLSLALRVDGEQPIDITLEGNVSISQESQRVRLDDIQLIVGGITAQPLEITANGDVDIKRQIADLQIALQTGPTRGNGMLRYASFESPQVDANLKLNQFNPALLALAGPDAATAAQDEAAPATGDEPLPLDAIRLIDTRARLEIDEAVFAPHTVKNVKASLRALEGVITVGTFTGEVHGGKLDLTATFNGRHNTATLNTQGKVESLDIAAALAAMESEPLFSGTASLDWKLTGKGRTTNELITDLKGPIELTTREPILKGMSLESMLCQAVALVNQEQLTSTFPADTSFQTLGASLKLAEGKINLSPLQAGLTGIQLTGKGGLDLLSQDFKVTFKARLSPELEETDRACRVSKRLTAIDWPVKCKGNTSEDPKNWCGVETDEIIADLATNEAKRTVEKEAGKLLDKLFK